LREDEALKRIPQAIREIVMRRDRRQCRYCKVRIEDGRGHIHHLWGRNILPPAWSEIKESNDCRNLVLLCPTCHNKIHNPSLKDVEYWKTWRELALKMNLEIDCMIRE